MAITDFIGGVVRVLWKDIPYVGYFAYIDKDLNVILSDCMMYSNFLMCFKKTINYTEQHINYARLPVENIKWMEYVQRTEDQIKGEIAGIEEANLKKLFRVPHCLHCFKPKEKIPVEGDESGAAYTLIGNMDYPPRGPKYIIDYVTLLEGKPCPVCENGGNAGASETSLWSQAEGGILKCVLTNPNYYETLRNLPGQNNAGMQSSSDPFSNPTYAASAVPVPTEFKIKVGPTRYSLQYINGNLPRPLTEAALNNRERASDIHQIPTGVLPNYIINLESLDNNEDMINGGRTSGFGIMEGFGSVRSFENMENVPRMENRGYMENVGNMNPDNIGNMGRFGVIGSARNMRNSQNFESSEYARMLENTRNLQSVENVRNIGGFETASNFGIYENAGNYRNTENVRGVGNMEDYVNMISDNCTRAIQHLEHNMRAIANGANIENMDGNRGIGLYTVNRQPHYHTGHVSDFQREPSLPNTENLEWGYPRGRIPSSFYCPYHMSSLNGISCPHALSYIYANQYL